MILSTPRHRRSVRLLGGTLVVSAALALGGCAGSPTAAISPRGTETTRSHGAVSGAQELGEPQSRIVYADAAGRVRELDLITESDREIARFGALDTAVRDGRFFVAQAGGDDTRVSVVDTGVWTKDHEDHAHYYQAEPGEVVTFSGEGRARVVADESVTAVTFADEPHARVLDRDALAEGELDESYQFDIGLDASVTPFGQGFLVAGPFETGDATVSAVDRAGRPIGGASHACSGLTGQARTNVGAVFGCAEGALLVRSSGGVPVFELIAYPEGTDAARRPLRFEGREGRPALGAVAGVAGAWHLDTRAREWTFIPTELPLLRVSAVGDEDRLLVAVDTAGRVLVLSAVDGRQISASEPLVAASAVDPALASAITLTVAASRAYVTAPLEQILLEIDYREQMKVLRSFDLPISPIAAELFG